MIIRLAPVAAVVVVSWSLLCVLIGWWWRNARFEVERVEQRHTVEKLEAEIASLKRELLDAEHRAAFWDPEDRSGSG